MKPRQLPWKWLAFSLIVIALASIPILSRLLGDTSRISELVTAELSKWSGGKVEITGPISVRYFPDISVRGKFTLTGATRLPLVKSIVAKDAKISLDLVDMLRGRVTVNALKLVKPVITLDRGPASNATIRTPRVLVASLFASGSVQVVHLRGGRLIMPTGRRHEIVREIDAHFDASDGTGAVSSFGSFTWRAEKVRFVLESGALTQGADALTMPVSLKLTSTPITLKISGNASFGSDFQLEGDMHVQMGSGRRFLSWTGVSIPEGRSLSAVSADGAFRLIGTTLTFDNGAFAIDGNTAVGLLAVTLGGPRPELEGTLDFDRLVLDPYLGLSDFGETTARQVPIRDRPLFEWALLKYFDADLRISAGAIDAHGLRLGPSAFTLTAKDGAFESEVGEVNLCEGSATGRIGADLKKATKHVSLTANFSDINVATCLEQLALPFPLAGVSSFKLELLSEGSKSDAFLRRLSGSLKVNARNGTVPLDLARLIGATLEPDGDGWSQDPVTEFDSLEADCRLGAGHMTCDTFTMRTPRGLVSGFGDIDLPRQAVDWNLSVGSPMNLARHSQGSDSAPPQVSIRGSLAQPTIRRADPETLGNGTGSTSPPPAVTPHQ
jgi:AsmA protein